MDINDVHKLEKATVQLLNFDGWNLTWTGSNYAHCDAEGFTPKGKSCCIEMKFRKTYYETKMLEKYKYDKLMELKQEVKLYFINDPKGNYLFWLNDIDIPPAQDMWCPDTTLWTKKKTLKPCILLHENTASVINKN
jgi:hypothetical protein